MEALSLGRECKELEERHKSNCRSEIQSANEPLKMGLTSSEMHKRSSTRMTMLLIKVSKHQFVHKIAECVGWKKLWDHALDHGPSVIKGNEEPCEGDYLPRSFTQQMSSVRYS